MLIAVAAALAFFVFMLVWWLAAMVAVFVFRARSRLGFQFSLRSLFLLSVVVALPCGWLASEREAARKQREAVDRLRNAWGDVIYDSECDSLGNVIPAASLPKPHWLQQLLGADFFATPRRVFVTQDSQLTYVKDMPGLRELRVGYPSGDEDYSYEVTDRGLENIKNLRDLRQLVLDFTHITDAGLRQLKGLDQLEQLGLQDTRVTDAGLEHLEGLKRLRDLALWNANVSHEGLEKLQRALPNCQIHP